MNTRNLFLATAFATGCAIAPAHTQTIPIFLDYAISAAGPRVAMLSQRGEWTFPTREHFNSGRA